LENRSAAEEYCLSFREGVQDLGRQDATRGSCRQAVGSRCLIAVASAIVATAVSARVAVAGRFLLESDLILDSEVGRPSECLFQNLRRNGIYRTVEERRFIRGKPQVSFGRRGFDGSTDSARLAPCSICFPTLPARYALGVGERCDQWRTSQWSTGASFFRSV
jgi:hypothetical protein